MLSPESVGIKAVAIPGKMRAPIISIEDSSKDVKVSWIEPDYSGEPLLRYIVKIFDKSLATDAYVEFQSVCNGSAPVVMASRECLIGMNNFTASYDYDVGDLIKIIVIAENSQGLSDYTEVTSGLLVQGLPQPPSDFSGIAISDQSIKLSWTLISLIPSADNGFTEITGYEVWRYNATDPDIKYPVPSFSNFYVDTSSITSGTSYKYVV